MIGRLFRRFFPSQSSAAPSPNDLGRYGEWLAEQELLARGHKILARRFRAAGGEIDLISTDGQTLYFIEIKTRRTGTGFDPAEGLSEPQKERLRRAAESFRASRGLLDMPCQLDAALLRLTGDEARIEWIEHALAPGQGSES